MAIEMCIPVPGDVPTFVGYSVVDVDCSGDYTGQYFDVNWGALGHFLPNTSWVPCSACAGGGSGGGGGGGSAGSIAQIEFTWQQGTFQDSGSGSTAWPDGGALATLFAEHWTPAPIAGGFVAWQCIGIVVVVHNVGTATSGDIVVSLQDDAGNNYGTVTITSGTSPDSPGTAKFIKKTISASASAATGTRLQWVVNDAPLGNDYWVEAFALGVLS